ncbi:MAG: SDR family oxidoreductase [Nannocystales bacterium]
MPQEFLTFAKLPLGLHNAEALVAASRAGWTAVVGMEQGADLSVVESELETLAKHHRHPFAVAVDALGEQQLRLLERFVDRGLSWILADADVWQTDARRGLESLRRPGIRVLVTVRGGQDPASWSQDTVDGAVLTGHESAGFVGEQSSFALVQRWAEQGSVPLYVHGGMTLHSAAACAALGVAGGVFDSQLLLLDDLRPTDEFRGLLSKLSGTETVAVGSEEFGEYCRVLVRPRNAASRAFAEDGKQKRFDELRALLRGSTRWDTPNDAVLPMGQDVGFAASFAQRYGSLAALKKAIEAAIDDSLQAAVRARASAPQAPLAEALGTELPVVQGPMTRVSDRAGFARQVSDAGGLPMVALALVRGDSLRTLLAECARELVGRRWGVGLLGFAPRELLEEQVALAREAGPSYAIIAGGRPDQAVALEAAGIPSFLHVPGASLVGPFVRGGARRFIFEGRECGGHVGPLSSFVLWSSMVDGLVEILDAKACAAEEVQVLFAGGIHDARSSALVQVLAAPLLRRGVRVGVLMGSAYLFTNEIVESGAIVPRFQQEVLACERTVPLVSGPGHASRCAYTPFAKEFFRKAAALEGEADGGRKVLDDLVLGRLRIASKGIERDGSKLVEVGESGQAERGMYMLGQVATLRCETTTLAQLHTDVTLGALDLLEHTERERASERPVEDTSAPLDVAIVGLGSLFPSADTVDAYWDNIVDNVDAISEVPRHRWDWRLYYDADPKAPDKVYSKWGGFLDDLVFDPTRYGMPPRSVAAVDPIQLVALEVAARTLKDAGYADGDHDHSRTSVILGASGGSGDVGTQYGLRAELPRFTGSLPPEVAERLPEWTEDSFAGILNNVVAGRIASRFDFGGVNFTSDAACASSLTSVYQAAQELVSGRADLALAGGFDTVQGPFGYLCFSKTSALSPRGRCRTFDRSGDGIVISEGVAMVALKRLADAERDGDRIYAVLKGVAGSSDGRARALTAPHALGQLRAMRRAYDQAGFTPNTVELFEAHGTGTVAGDTTELKSTTRLLMDAGARPRRAVIGSVKTNVGHTKSAAGVAGLMKVAQALYRRVLPPHRVVDDPLPSLRTSETPLHLIDQARPWIRSPEHPRRGAVSAFGFGGTNFHAVLEEYGDEYRPWLRPAPTTRWPAELLVWSAASREGLLDAVNELKARVDQGTSAPLRVVAAALAGRHERCTHTLALLVRSEETMVESLERAVAFLGDEGQSQPEGVFYGAHGEAAPKLAVLFSGQGSQYPEMLRELCVRFGVFLDTWTQAESLTRDAFEARFGSGQTLSRFVFPAGCYDDETRSAAAASLTATDVAQPALGAVEAAALHLMQRLGLRADMFGGHSYGEFVALYAGGVLDLESMLRLSVARGRAIVDSVAEAGKPLGTMAAALAPREVVENAVSDLEGVVVANHNGPEQVVISGTEAGIEAAQTRLSEAGVRVRRFPVAAGFHSPLVEPARAALREAIDATTWSAPTTPVYANTTGERHGNEADALKEAMNQHLVRPVEFVAQVEAMLRDGAEVFVELGPKSVLTSLVRRIAGDRPHLAVSIDDKPGIEGLLAMTGRLLSAGVPLDVERLFEGRADTIAVADLPPVEAVPSHAWLVNGSGVRPAGTPPRQVGVTLEDVAAPEPPADPGSEPASAPRTPATAVPAPAPAPRAPVTATQTRSRVAPVSSPVSALPIRRRPTTAHKPKAHPMTEHDESKMDGYFAMMQQFLETQERVMSVYLRSRATAGLVSTSARSVDEDRAIPDARVLAPAWSPVAADVSADPHPSPAPEVAAPPPVPVPVSAPVPAPTPASVAPAPTEPAAAILDREALTDLLLGVVEDKTGYPRDMLDLTQGLEADLGIDSIKRVEVATAVLELLPPTHRDAVTPRMSELNTQPTLDGMLGILGAASSPAVEGSRPFDGAEVGSGVDAVEHPPRFVVVPQPRALPTNARRSLEEGTFVVVRDTLGVAEALVEALKQQGREAVLWTRAGESEEALTAWHEANGAALRSVAGVVHLAALGASRVSRDAGAKAWRRALELDKSLFLLLRSLDPVLGERAHVLAATALGGTFARGTPSHQDGFAVQGGAVGMLKSYREERPGLRTKAVDLDPTLPADRLAEFLISELSVEGGRQEVGYPGGERTVFATVATPIAPADATAPQPWSEAGVVLATGGGRGVTAELLRSLARPGVTLILTGRRPMPEAESEAMAALREPAELRRHFIGEAKAAGTRATPVALERQVQGVVAARELRANLEDLAQRGATVEYHAVDVTDEDALAALFTRVRETHGDVLGVVHGAGVIEDKRLVDKTPASWSRVVETKVIGLALLQKLAVRPALEFFVVMSSVAGRYGNSGQSDYACANELMNRMCCQLRGSVRARTIALCWGPWGPTAFGSGMVDAVAEAKFAEKGVALVSPAVGRRLFADELAHMDNPEVEVVCGEGPWEASEEAIGAFARSPEAPGPLLGAAEPSIDETGVHTVLLNFDATHLYLDAHRIDGTAIVPAAAAAEVMAEAAQACFPNLRVAEIESCRLLKGIDRPETGRQVQVELKTAPDGEGGLQVQASLRQVAAPRRMHYRCVLRLRPELDAPSPFEHHNAEGISLSAKDAYGVLFHGPSLQVIERVDGLGPKGATAEVRASAPAEWMAAPDGRARWVFDPGLLDAGPQLAIVWARQRIDKTVLPVEFGRIVRFTDTMPARLTMVFERLATTTDDQILANVSYLDATGRLVMRVEGLRGIATAGLNRLAAEPARRPAAAGER